MLNALNHVIAVLHASCTQAIEPVLLQRLLIKKSIVAVMPDLAWIISITRSK